MSIYLDHAATTAVDPCVHEKMLSYFSECYGNASSRHHHGMAAAKGILEARSQVAAALSVNTDEIYFTSGGTESNNWVIKEVAEKAGRGHIITTKVEHHSVLKTCEYLERKGFKVTYLAVDSSGRVDAQSVKDAIRDDTVLISVMYANNETGSIMPIAEIGQIAKDRAIPFHCDAVQAIGHVKVDISECNIDLLSLSAHKFYGPKGVGVLYVRKGTGIESFMHGGDQEKKMRAGTLNTPGIVGLGGAIALAVKDLPENAAHEANLTKRLLDGIRQMSDTQLNGHEFLRLPGHLNIAFIGRRADALMIFLDQNGISVSTGAACSANVNEQSYVLRAMGLDDEKASGSIRFSIGRENNEAEIDRVVSVLKQFDGLHKR